MITFDKKTRKLILYIFLFVFVGWLINLIFFKPFNINLFYNRTFFTYLWKDPQQLFRLGVLDPYGIKIHYNTLTNISDRYIEEDLEYTSQQLEILKSYDFTSMSKAQRYSAQTLEYFLEDKIYKDVFVKYERTFSPFDGAHLNLILFFLNVHEVSNVKDLESYLERLGLVPRKISQIIRILELGEEHNNILPQVVLDHLTYQIKQFVDTPVAENILFKDFTSKLNKIPNLNPTVYQNTAYEIKILISEVILPSYSTLLEKIESLRPSAPEELGVKTYDTEGVYYTYLLKRHTTLDLLSESVFQTIEKDLDSTLNRIADLLSVLVEQGRVKPQKKIGHMVNNFIFGSVYSKSDSTFITDLKNQIAETSKRFQISDYELDKINIEPCLALFDSSLIDFAYYEGSIYNKREPKLYYNPALPKSKLLLPFWVFSWLIPGYHTQQLIQNSQSDLPIFRRHVKFNYYTMGWKIYSLDLAGQLKLYQPNLANKLAVLHIMSLHQSLALIDIGIHSKEWSYEKAFKILVDQIGLPPRLAHLQILAVVMSPGQYVSAIVGYKAFQKKEQTLREQLGQAFDLVEHIEQVLTLGPVPMRLFQE